ncbi:MAG: GFA family protein [Sphingomonadaceae bacterium]|nr:GFA family protein [Novosphingobium sp.]MCP5397476.1 GFA family protein [Sphingomonadaceae bacterium]
MNEAVREGGCACGHVRYRVAGEPMMVHNCHCRLCQQQTGSTSVVNAFFESERIELLTGELTRHVVQGGSGKSHTIFRCTQCGTAIWSQYSRLGSLSSGLRAGTLDDPGSVTPDVVIFTASKMPWVTLPEGIPAFPAYYDFAEVLPPDRLARLQALVARRQAGEG